VIHELEDLLDKPVRVRTAYEPNPTGFMNVIGISEGVLTLENNPGEVVIVPWTAVLSIQIDYSAARSEGWHPPPNHSSYVEARKKLFEAEQGSRLGLPEADVDDAALAAEWQFRGFALAHPKNTLIPKLRERARLAAVGPVEANADTSVTAGPIDALNYRRAAYHHGRLRGMLAGRQPENDVVRPLIAVALHAGNALAKYPAHAELRGWFDEAEAIRKKLSEKTRADAAVEAPFVAGDVARLGKLYAD
jgi:hypothetical protein